ncbi:MAG: hypothetical protein EXS46_03195 [Candidatus Taylorbacteria bacterium]|nr:hypothetical protein [Candidatus Taylorbacteria bacterium]
MEPQQNSSDSRKYVIGIIIVALVIVGISLANRNRIASDSDKQVSDTEQKIMDKTVASTNAQTDVTTNQGPVVVEYTDANGFTPENLTLKVGDTVKFVNSSTGKMWVGVDEHPTHTEYDNTTLKEHCAVGATLSFDQCGDGKEYSFTFTKAGSWDYHNHSRSNMRGTVVVK